MRNYDIFVAKIYDYTHIDSFWGSAGLIDSPTSSATMPTTNDCTVLLTEQKLWVIELQMNIKLFCINCTQFLKIMCKSPPDHFCCRSASAWGDKWCNDSFYVMLQIFRSKGFITMSRAGEICEACKSWGGELLRNGATCSEGECDPGTKAQSWAQKRDNKSTIESQWLGAVVASGQLRDKGRNFGAGCFQATMPVTQHTPWLWFGPGGGGGGAANLIAVLHFSGLICGCSKTGHFGATLAQWYQFLSVLVLRSVTLKQSIC